MNAATTLTTARLVLRPFTLDDAPAVRHLLQERAIAYNTLMIPHPYPERGAEQWIASHAESLAQGHHHFAIVADGELAGAMTLMMRPENDRAEVGYWIGVPYWNRGYATEALAAVIAFGFEQLPIARIYAAHFARNPASGRVLAKAGMKHEGTLRKHAKKWDELVDLEFYGILKEEWSAD